MATHIDLLCGHYRDLIESNSAAIDADHKYVAREGAINFYSFYRCHNYHFKIYGATLARPCQHPDNIWSLHGYHECLKRLGRDDEAGIIARRLDLARSRATYLWSASIAALLLSIKSR